MEGVFKGPVWGDVLKVCNCRHFQGSGRRPGGGLEGACMGGCAESVQLSALLGVREAAWMGAFNGACMGGCAESVQLSALSGVWEAAWRGSSRGLYGGMC